jgi:LEA14-like dessication related protein
MRLGTRVVGTVLVVLATACSAIGANFTEPDVRLDRVIVRGVNLTGGTLDLIVDVHNPNNFDLRGTSLRLGFEVEDSHLGDVTYDDAFAVDRGDTTELTLPLRFGWAGVGSAVRSALGYGEIPYTMKGELGVQTPFGKWAVPFTREGRAPLIRRS